MAIAEANPILVRETRVRWRGNRAFWMAFIYTTALSATMVWRYNDFMKWQGEDGLDPAQVTARLGHELFALRTWMQTLGWLLLAPALTSTSIAGERESGMLEAVLLSRLSPLQIVMGKLLSALSFIVLISLISLPITAVCFLLGGVSGGEFRIALALHLTTALTAASVGLAASAHYRRALGAMAMGFTFLFFWNIASTVAWYVTDSGILRSALSPQAISILLPILQLFGYTNPILASIDLATPLHAPYSTVTLPFDYPIWSICIPFQLLSAISRIWQAVHSLKKPLAEQWWQEATSAPQQPVATPTSPTGLPEVSATYKSTPPRSAADHTATSRRAWIEFPIASRLVFANALLQREARSKFRLHRPPRLIIALFALPVALLGYLYLRVFLLALTDSNARESIWWIAFLTFAALTILIATVMGAITFTREKEHGTWESLWLTLLPTRSILTAKVLAPILACFLYGILLWPLLIPCIGRVATVKYHYSEPDASMSLTQALSCLMIWMSVVWACATWGALCSWFCRTTMTAVSWALGSLFILWVFVPMFLLWSFQGGNDFEIVEFMRFWHPAVAIAPIISRQMGPGERSSTLWDGCTSATSFFIIGCLLFFHVHQSLNHRRGLDN